MCGIEICVPQDSLRGCFRGATKRSDLNEVKSSGAGLIQL
jgi:hypothetical protein